jgi:DNA-binding Xre family transcriptional regulator
MTRHVLACVAAGFVFRFALEKKWSLGASLACLAFLAGACRHRRVLHFGVGTETLVAPSTKHHALGATLCCLGARGMVPAMAKQVRLTLAKALAKANLRRAEAGEKAITMNSLAVQAGVAATTITRLARNDDKAAAALSLDLAGKIVTVLDCGIEDLLEVVEGDLYASKQL